MGGTGYQQEKACKMSCTFLWSEGSLVVVVVVVVRSVALEERSSLVMIPAERTRQRVLKGTKTAHRI
jgi:hypothetical protein